MKISSEKLNKYLIIPLQLWYKSDKYNGHYMKGYLLFGGKGGCRITYKTFLTFPSENVSNKSAETLRVFIMFSGPGWLSRYSDSHTGWTVLGSNPGGGRFFSPLRTGPGTHPASCTMGTGFLSRGQSASGLSWPELGRTLSFYFTVFSTIEGGKPVKNHGALALLKGTQGPITLHIFLSSSLITLFVDYTN
jgi:hypothetical protein